MSCTHTTSKSVLGAFPSQLSFIGVCCLLGSVWQSVASLSTRPGTILPMAPSPSKSCLQVLPKGYHKATLWQKWSQMGPVTCRVPQSGQGNAKLQPFPFFCILNRGGGHSKALSPWPLEIWLVAEPPVLPQMPFWWEAQLFCSEHIWRMWAT